MRKSELTPCELLAFFILQIVENRQVQADPK
jgi:hypothetical protein